MAIATICVPCGPRHIELLPRAIASAKAQTMPVEVVWLIDTDRRGPGWARNEMVKNARTPFIITLDADDLLHPEFTAKTFAKWLECDPDTYVYTDWESPGRGHQRAVSCYGLTRHKDESLFHLPPTLFPTRLYHAIGGYDESLWMAEDTDFYLKANAMGIKSAVVREPLMVYTDDGFRSKEGFKDPRWNELATSVFRRYPTAVSWRRVNDEIQSRYTGRLSMACCGKPGEKNTVATAKRLEGDILVRPLWNARMKTYGRVTKRLYGSIGRAITVWIDPKDFNEREYERVPDMAALAPTPAEIQEALADVETHDHVTITAANPASVKTTRRTDHELTADDLQSVPTTVSGLKTLIKRAGIRDWSTGVAHGFDIQQTPDELAKLLHLAQERGVKRVLEIGTGQHAGLARFMTRVLGWEVFSIDIEQPNTDDFTAWDKWVFIHGNSATVQHPALDEPFDMVFIDGDHSYDATKADYERFSKAAPLVAFHDIAPDGWWGKDDQTGGFWREIAYTPKSKKLRAGFGEFITPGAKQGIGYYVND